MDGPHGWVLARQALTSPGPWPQEAPLSRLTHLGVVGGRVLGHSTLLLHQETEAPALLGQGRLVPVRHVALQLPLLAADGVNVLGTEGRVNGDRTRPPLSELRASSIPGGRKAASLRVGGPLPMGEGQRSAAGVSGGWACCGPKHLGSHWLCSVAVAGAGQCHMCGCKARGVDHRDWRLCRFQSQPKCTCTSTCGSHEPTTEPWA